MNATRLFCRTATGLTLGLTLSLGIAIPSLATLPAVAQARGPVQRVIKGKVADKGGAGIKGAVVYLRDGRTSAVKSAIADDDGEYRFVQLSQGTDYEIWAQSDDKKSKTHTISSFDTKNEFVIALTIDK